MKIRGVPGLDRPSAQWALVILAVAIVVLAGLVIRRDRGMQGAIAQLKHDYETVDKQNGRLEGELARERSARQAFELGLGRERTTNTPAALALQPGLDRGGKPKQELRIPRDVARVQLVLPIGGRRFPRYRASIRPFAGGEDIWSHAALQSDLAATRVFVTVPMDAIASGAYELRLQGVDASGKPQELATFTFDVVRN